MLTFFCDSFYPLFLAANTQATVLLALTMIILLILSFFISGAEVAFFSLTYRDINLLKTKQDPGWKRIANLLEEPKLLATTLQISNTFVNIAIIILANVLIDQIPLMLRCGIDSFAVTNGTALRRLAENRLPGIDNHYQPTARPSEGVGSYSWRRRA